MLGHIARGTLSAMSVSTETLLLLVGVWLLFGIAALVVANSRGLKGPSWFLLGLLLGPLGLLLAFTSKPAAPVAFNQSPAAAPVNAQSMTLVWLLVGGLVAVVVVFIVMAYVMA